MPKNNLHLSGGVGRKLFAAFFAVSLFSLASALVGWVGLGYVREAQDEVLSEIYPSVRDAQSIARESTALVLQMSSLFEVRSIDQLEQRTGAVRQREHRLSALLARFDNADLFEGLRTQLEPNISSLSDDVESLTALSRETIETGTRFDANLVNLLALTETLIDETKNLSPIVAENAIDGSDVIIELLNSDAPNRQTLVSDAFAAFVQQILGNLQKITDLQFRSETMRDQLVRLGDVSSIDQVRVLRDSVVLDLRAATNSVVRLDIPGTQQGLAEPLSNFSDHVFGSENIFWQREQILTNRVMMDKVRATADAAGQKIGGLVEQIVAKTQDVMNQQSENARSVALQTQGILIVLAALAFGASILIYAVYINNNILFRLHRLSSSVSRLIGGDYSIPVFSSGHDQITGLEEAVEAFRGKSISLQKAENNLISRSAELERSNQDLQQFAYVTSHDLRAPLRAITSLTVWVEEDLAEGNTEAVASNLVRLRSRAQRMDSLLNGILQYARAGSRDADNERIPFTATVQQIFDDLNNDERFALSVRTNVDTVFTGTSFLHQVIGNMISNAIKHHDKPRGSIEIELASDRFFNTLTISDDGPGIPENMREKVFKMFQTLKPRDEMEASGIGLALVKRLVERRAGKLSVDKVDAGGACFTIKWPIEGE